MQIITSTQVLLSASDLTAYNTCQFAFLRALDYKLGRDVPPPPPANALLQYAARLGLRHEARQLAKYRDSYDTVVEIAAPTKNTPAELSAAQNATLAALRDGAEIVFQATFYVDPATAPAHPVPGSTQTVQFGFVGFADFLQRTKDGTYQVQDTKLTATAKVTALLQLAAYAEQLQQHRIPLAKTVALLHGNNTVTNFELRDITPFLAASTRQLRDAIAIRLTATDATGNTAAAAPVTLTDPNVKPCLRCDTCKAAAQHSDDLSQIAGITPKQRRLLLHAGITTLTAFAAQEPAITSGSFTLPGENQNTLQRLVWQAQGQHLSRTSSVAKHAVLDPQKLAGVAAATPHHIYLSLHHNTFWSTRTGLTGLTFTAAIHQDGQLTILNATNLSSERDLLWQLRSHLAAALTSHPTARIYHYGRSLRSQLVKLAARHGKKYEGWITWLLSSEYLVDLQQSVKNALQIGIPEYTLAAVAAVSAHHLKQPQPLATDPQADTICTPQALLLAEVATAPQERETALKTAITDYLQRENQALQLIHQFLLWEQQRQAITPQQQPASSLPAATTAAGGAVTITETVQQRRDLADQFAAQAQQWAAQEQPQLAVAFEMLEAAFEYHRRERAVSDEEFYWRMNTAPEHWGISKDTVLLDPGKTLVTPWQPASRGNKLTRRLYLQGQSEQREPFQEKDRVRLVYAPPAPPGASGVAASGSWYQYGTVRSVAAAASAQLQQEQRLRSQATPTPQPQQHPTQAQQTAIMMVEEQLDPHAVQYQQAPLAVLDGKHISTEILQQSLASWATALQSRITVIPAADRAQLQQLPDAGWQLLLRAAPRLTGGAALLQASHPEVLAYAENSGLEPKIAAIARAAAMLEHSVLPVQGPPGAGKSYVSARVIKHLVQLGKRVGVVSQSHAVVEHLLAQIVKAGVPAGQVVKAKYAKHTAAHYSQQGFTAVANGQALAAQLAQLSNTASGFVCGGTAWTFSSEKLFPAHSLDLLVVDEGGQFGMVSTLAALRAAKNLMLVGDPQQLPQVSQGEHPVPIDASALGWLMADAATLQQDKGFFLSASWRMHPELCALVSDLSYDGQLEAAVTSRDTVTGWVAQGLHLHHVQHEGNSTESPEEAQLIVTLCQQALNSAQVVAADGASRRLEMSDIIVVAPYNVQVSRLRQAFTAAGLHEVRVGTVDNFQGQEAQLAFVSMTASNAADSARGIEFLLNRNRLNVAISRAKWAAHLVLSPVITQVMPETAEQLRCLAGFLRLTAAAHHTATAGEPR